jgi:hypothetical protein
MTSGTYVSGLVRADSDHEQSPILEMRKEPEPLTHRHKLRFMTRSLL